MKNFRQLISAIEQVHQNLQASAANAVNKALTIRNWIIGLYIVEFEQHGKDRAKYGTNLIPTIADNLNHINGIDKRALFRFRQFYLYYPQLSGSIRQILNPEMQPSSLFEVLSGKVGSVAPLLSEGGIMGSVTPQIDQALYVPPDLLLAKLSYTHLEQLLSIDDPLKRTFYEIACIKGTWSVRELKRQINSLYFERSGLSAEPAELAALVQQKTTPQAPRDIIKNIYAFEFLDIPIRAIVEESDIEAALLDHLQQFIMELGYGFCLEARQKRILIGENYYFIDLVFYHRVLKCHVLVELKIGAFEHSDIGQLNTYINYFKDEMGEADDNPPVGMLLVAEKDQALVKYATAGMDQNLFVQKYLVQMPQKEMLVQHIENELKKLL